MNAVKLLLEDHSEFRNLIHQIETAESDGQKKKLFGDLKSKLDIHTHIEEEVFYPAVKEAEGIDDIVGEGIQEHHQTDLFIREIENLADGSDVFEPKLKVLIEGVEHHIQEEENELFPKVEEKFSQSDLEELGTKMETEKRKFRKADSAGG